MSHTTARALPGAGSRGFPTPARAAQTVLHTRWPACTSDAAGPGAAASARNALERHSKAAMWIALRTEVVGACGDGTEKERLVGWMSTISGSRSFGRNDGAVGVWESLGSRVASSTAMTSSQVSSIALSSALASAALSSKTSSSIPSSSAPGSRSGSGSVAHTPVNISRASCTNLRPPSTRSRPTSVSDLWSNFGPCFVLH